jgi:hypothetical protein
MKSMDTLDNKMLGRLVTTVYFEMCFEPRWIRGEHQCPLRQLWLEYVSVKFPGLKDVTLILASQKQTIRNELTLMDGETVES